MPLSPGQIINNRYRIVKLLGQGGMGAVYRAWDMNLNVACALKENLDTSPGAQRQFAREATLLATLRHPNMPRVSDHFSLPGQGQYLAMDYVEGEDLQAKLDRTAGPLSEAQVLPWIIQVCDALTYLHSHRPPIIHRDIKPANIKITPEGQAILVDFGIAKVFDPNLKTTLGAQAVTPGYSPPEQYGQGKTDARSDIYSLGATLFALVTGQIPPDSVDVITHKITRPPPIRSLNPKVSPQVSAAVEKAMQPDWEKRFTSAAEFAAKLRSKPAVQKPQPAMATFGSTAPASGISPVRSPSRRVLWKWILGGVLILALLFVGDWTIRYFTSQPNLTPTERAGAALSSHTPRPNASPLPLTPTGTPLLPTGTFPNQVESFVTVLSPGIETAYFQPPGGVRTQLRYGNQVPFSANTRLWTTSDTAQLAWSQGPVLALGEDSAIVVGAEGQDKKATLFLERGRLLVTAHNLIVQAYSNPGFEVEASDASMGLFYDPSKGIFQVDCLEGNCRVGTQELSVGQRGEYNQGILSPQVMAADEQAWSDLGWVTGKPATALTFTAQPSATLTETPTPTMTSTQTALSQRTATRTPVATPTRRRPKEPPTWTPAKPP